MKTEENVLDLKALKVEAMSLVENANALEKDLPLTTFLERESKRNIENFLYEYNSWVSKVNKILKGKSNILPTTHTIPLRSLDSLGVSYGFSRADVLHFLYIVKKECKKIIVIIDEILRKIETKIPEEKTKELRKIDDEIKQKIEPELPLCAEDLHMAIKTLEAGFSLSPILICGRIIDVILDKMASHFGIKEKDWKEKTTNKMIEIGLIEKGEKHISLAIKLWRDKYSHKIGKYPADIEDSYITILGTSKLLKSLIKRKFHRTLNLE